METEEQQRLYVLIPPSPLFAAHWSFFLPQSCSYDPVKKRYQESTKGRRIHVSGDRLNGFTLEIIRDYDVSKHRSVGTRGCEIGIVPAKHLEADPDKPNDEQRLKHKDDDEGGGYMDNKPLDAFERVCVEVQAPGPSLNSARQDANVSNGKRTKTEVRDCQWWVRQVVNLLEEREMVLPLPRNGSASSSKKPSELAASLPMH